MRCAPRKFLTSPEVNPILKYLVAVTDHLASFSLMVGLIFSYLLRFKGRADRLIVWAGAAAGILGGGVVFGVRLFDPKGMNLPLMRFNRWAVVVIAAAASVAFLWIILSGALLRGRRGARWIDRAVLAALTFLSLTYLMPQIFQYTQEFVYFGESGLSTRALLRGIGFVLGLGVCLMLALSAFEVHRALGDGASVLFLSGSLLLFFLEYGVRAVAALQRLKVIGLSDFVFELMIFGDRFQNVFVFAQLALALLMLLYVFATHRRVVGEFRNKALLRKERARLRGCRRWSAGLFFWSAATVLIVVVLNYLDTKPPADLQPESYDLDGGVITIALDKVSDGHLHKFAYDTPGGYNVRFLVVKKPAGNAYGLGLDACEICGIAGYYERGDEDVVCRRCDVVMNKNTIGFRGGCNPIPFPYEVRDSKIYIDVKELERHEKRFK